MNACTTKGNLDVEPVYVGAASRFSMCYVFSGFCTRWRFGCKTYFVESRYTTWQTSFKCQQVMWVWIPINYKWCTSKLWFEKDIYLEGRVSDGFVEKTCFSIQSVNSQSHHSMNWQVIILKDIKQKEIWLSVLQSILYETFFGNCHNFFVGIALYFHHIFINA